MKSIFILAICLFLHIECFAALGQIFVPANNSYERENRDYDNMSINDISATFNLNIDQFYIYGSFASNSDILFVCFKIFTDDIVYVCTQSNISELTKQDVDIFLKEYSLKKDFDSSDQENSLEDGIENRSLTIDFMADVLNLDYVNGADVLESQEFGYKLFFEDGVLVDYSSLDGLNKWAKEWKDNFYYEFYHPLEKEAKLYCGDNENKIIECMNAQADAWANIPHGLQNQHISLFTNKQGLVNFKMLLVAFYGAKITLREFKDINFGEFKFIKKESKDAEEYYIYESYGTILFFDENGNLVIAKHTSEL